MAGVALYLHRVFCICKHMYSLIYLYASLVFLNANMYDFCQGVYMELPEFVDWVPMQTIIVYHVPPIFVNAAV